LGKHIIELHYSQKSGNSYHERKPGVTKPDGDKEDRKEDY
jgi:hypothetical protein